MDQIKKFGESIKIEDPSVPSMVKDVLEIVQSRIADAIGKDLDKILTAGITFDRVNGVVSWEIQFKDQA